jgi:hypothetical protein
MLGWLGVFKPLWSLWTRLFCIFQKRALLTRIKPGFLRLIPEKTPVMSVGYDRCGKPEGGSLKIQDQRSEFVAKYRH